MKNNKMLEIMKKNNISKQDLKELLKTTEIVNGYQQYLKDNEEVPINWNNSNQKKYYIVYGYQLDKLSIQSAYSVKYQGCIYTSREESINEYIEKVGIENFKKYVLGVSSCV